jgi:putative CocE/NonD family hydrolase
VRRRCSAAKKGPFISIVLLFFVWLIFSPARAADEEKISSLGRYSGYTPEIYDGFVRTSEYVSVSDGTKLAVDIFRPTRGGVVANEPLPVIWTYERYHRADMKGGRPVTELDESPWLRIVIRHGYVIGAVDARGAGASFGSRQGELLRREAQDCYDVTEWFASQPWCTKRVGMFGRSYMGTIQYLAASLAPPHLKAIFPEMAMFDLYSFVYPGGIFRSDFISKWSERLRNLDTVTPAVPVDGDGALLANALQGHQANQSVLDMVARFPFRDSKDSRTGSSPYVERSPATYLDQIRKSKVAIYELAGWYDMWSKDAILWFLNLDNPRKLVVGPWAHTQSTGLDLAAEHLRWYDYWLRDVHNTIMDDPPISYYVMDAPTQDVWRSAWQWPLPDQKPDNYYFREGPSNTVGSPNDGLLLDEKPGSDQGKDDYKIDYTTTSGRASRWTNGYGGSFGYPNMAINDSKSLTYTTKPFPSDVQITGHPVIDLSLSASSKDLDLFAYLEEVDQGGNSRYLTEGALRVSHRAISVAPFNDMGLPYCRSFVADSESLVDGRPVDLAFDLLPTSFIVPKGNRIRVSITGADADNASTPEQPSPPVVSIFRNVNHMSYMTLPIIEQSAKRDEAAAHAEAGAGRNGILVAGGLAMLAVGITLAVVAFRVKWAPKRGR